MAASPSIPPSRSFSSKKKTSSKGAKWPLFLRRAGIALALALILLMVAFALLPVWISNAQGRAYVIQRMNQRLAAASGGGAARLSVADWSLGWFRPTDIKNLRITLADGSLLLECPNIHSGLTLWDIICGNFDLRSTSADALHLEIVKYADGRNSLQPLIAACANVLGTVRGGIQINGATVSLTSLRSTAAMRYTDLKATLTIASPDAPFHLQLSAVGKGDPAGKSEASQTGELSVDATLPALRTLGRPNQAGIWDQLAFANSLLGDIDFSATNLPSGVFCDCLGLDAGWEESLGSNLDSVKFTNHAASPQGASRPTLLIHGTGASDGNQTSIDGHLLLQISDEHGIEPSLTIPAAPGANGGKDEFFHLDAALLLSPNLVKALGRINPLLGEAQPGAATGLVHVNVVSLSLPLEAGSTMADAQAAARITFPLMRFPAIGTQSSLTHQLLGTANVYGSAVPEPALQGAPGILHVTLGDGAFSYENFIVTVGRSRMNFSGEVGLDGQIDLLAILPGAGPSGLSSENTQVVIDGTVDAPMVHRAQ